MALSAFEGNYKHAHALWNSGRYLEAGDAAIRAAKYAEDHKLVSQAAKAWHLAGSSSLAALHFKDALQYFDRGMQLAKNSSDRSLEVFFKANIASVQLQLGDAAASLRYSTEGLRMTGTSTPSSYIATLTLLRAKSFARLKRYPEALAAFRESLGGLEESEDRRNLLTAWFHYGSAALESGDLQLAEFALTRCVYICKMTKINEYSGAFSKLARVKELNGDWENALRLHNAAVAAPAEAMPRWLAYADRGQFHLNRNNFSAAHEDFQAARLLLRVLREDIVPNDQGRVNLENGLGRVADGFIDSGNHLTFGPNRETIAAQTFEAAEAHHALTISALTPETADWRSRLPERYWDLLSQFRALQRSTYSSDNAALRARAQALQLSISQLEAEAGSDRRSSQPQALDNVRRSLGPDELFLSFHTGERDSWLWTVETGRIRIYHLPPAAELEALAKTFRANVKGAADYENSGRRLFLTLFGQLPERAVHAKRWLLEPDGPLFEVPFAALVTPDGKYLCEQTALQLSPGAQLLRKGRELSHASFLGIADPIYNGADSRFAGRISSSQLALTRLPASSSEVTACSRVWSKSKILNGPEATASNVFTALRAGPDIVHFATHIIASPGEYRSGLIALSLDRKGDMDLVGPVEIISRKMDTELVVMNGCQSGQAEVVPGSGLMGLTRAWIASGVNNVLATQWDISDGDSQALLTAFYSALREHPDESPAYALHRARAAVLNDPEIRKRPSTWAAYFLLSRT